MAAQRRAEVEKKAEQKQLEDSQRLRQQARDEMRQMRWVGGWVGARLAGELVDPHWQYLQVAPHRTALCSPASASSMLAAQHSLCCQLPV